ncbi:alpha/beta hydrolase [Fulvimarina endophytica]|uniref:Alpha/beta hydrolase n=1 Tax=Fulvimarina endophytica TaxID=2293836 RepID=A0A371X9Y0_9HYPH|nr:alpha/beta hydrolase [Fulvimarina endophytica]RFC66029.1 alpha/beta hydrolase [Fulvimarina endophytica]
MLKDQAREVLDDLARKSRVQIEPNGEAQTLAQARAMTASMADYSGSAPDSVISEDIEVPGGDGDIPVRLYRPAMVESARLLVWYHGGGAMAGSLDGHDKPLRQLCAATGRVIASVGYRLAPEHPSPAPQDDCIAATRHLMAKAGELRCEPSGIAIGGDSIGGLLAAVTVLALRQDDAELPSALVMLYPNTDLRPDRDCPSLREQSGHVMTEESLLYENGLFVPEPLDRSDAKVSPHLARDLYGFPRTLIVTCEHDPLRDEGEAFAGRLEESGCSVEHERLDGMIHGVLQMAGWIDEAAKLQARIADFLSASPAKSGHD